MRILFCAMGYSAARDRLRPLLPTDDVVACDPANVRSSLAGVSVVVPYVARIDDAIIAAGRFGLVQQFGVGLETVDVDAATRAGVWVARVPSKGIGNAESVAEHAVLLMLALARHWPAGANINGATMGEPSGAALHGKTACIVGLGDVGSAVAARLSAFGMRLVAVRRRESPHGEPSLGVSRVFGPDGLREAVRDADFVVLCVKHDASSVGLIDESVLSSVKAGSYLVNVARGGLVDHDALERALASGRIVGAGLDVFWSEPPDPEHAIFKQNVIATPHVAGVTDDSYDGIARVVAENVERFRRGEPPLHAVNAPTFVRG